MALIKVNKIGYYKGDIKTKQKFHITVGHQTIIGSTLLFGTNEEFKTEDDHGFTSHHQYEYIDSVKNSEFNHIYALITFEKSVISPPEALLIGSKLDTDIKLN